MTIKRIKTLAWRCRCARCGRRWSALGPKPNRCRFCKAHHFDKPARPYARRKSRA